MENFCGCGCGGICSNRFINGHNRRGKKFSEETLKKLRGRKLSEEQKNNMRKRKMGHKVTDETRQKIRIKTLEQFKYGMPLKTRLLLSKILKGRRLSKDRIEQMRVSSLGRKIPQESIKKRNESRRRNGWFKEPEKHSKRWIELRKNQVFPVKDTSIEIRIQDFLQQLGYEFFAHKYIKEIEHCYQCDIFVPAMNLVIECDGDYWHSYPTGTEIDHIRTKELLEKGFKVLRLWESEINKISIDAFKERLNW